MATRCEICGRPLLTSDAKCYHCNTPVPGREEWTPEADEDNPDFKAAARYGVVVLGLMLFGVLLMSWAGADLDAPPITESNSAIPAGWREVIPPDQSYRIWLPESWEIYNPESPEWDEILRQAPQPLPDSFRREEPTGVASRASLVATGPTLNGEHAPIFVLQLHPGLEHYSLQTLQVDNWSNGGVPIDASDGIEPALGESDNPALMAELVYLRGDGGGDWHSLTLLVKSESGVYAVAVSAEDGVFLQQEETLRQILDSFQR